MTKILVIAGHGENKNGSFDPGATGIITKGEHRYYEQDFFPAVKKFLPANSNVILFSEHNVYDYKDLVSLAKKYGNDTIVVEMHYDAGASSASGGHVIVHADYEPDKYDLAIRDVIKKHIGVRYTHKGHAGISGRANLGNCNRAKTAGINYRLVELGFGTNKKDATTMVNNIEAIAKDFVQALIGKANDKPVEVTNPATTTQTKGKTIKVGTQAKQWQTGSDIPEFVVGQTYDVLQEKTVDQSKSKKAYLIGKGTVATGWLLEQDVDGFKKNTTAAKPATVKKKRVYLPKSAKTWRVYKTSGPYTTGKEVGFLAPAQYGGLDYEIIRTIATDVYEIKTSAFGNVAIYAAKSTGATIK